jgi:hypothetical protein
LYYWLKRRRYYRACFGGVIEMGRCHGLDINVEKNEDNENITATTPVYIMKTTECGIFQLFG